MCLDLHFVHCCCYYYYFWLLFTGLFFHSSLGQNLQDSAGFFFKRIGCLSFHFTKQHQSTEESFVLFAHNCFELVEYLCVVSCKWNDNFCIQLHLILCCIVMFQTVSLHFNSHFPGGPWLAGTRMSPLWILLELRVMEVWVVTIGAIRHAKLRSKCHYQQTNIQFFYRLDALPVAQPAVSKHWRENSNMNDWSVQNDLSYVSVNTGYFFTCFLLI